MGDPAPTEIPRTAPPTEPGPAPFPVRRAPPTRPNAHAPEPTGWPIPIGIIAIVFGSFGIVSIIGSSALSGWTASKTGISYTPIGWASMALGLIAAAWHCVAGILTLRRSRRGPVNLIVWAIANSVLSVIVSVAGVAGLTVAYASGSAPTASTMGISHAMTALGVLLSLAWPVFLLIFLNQRARKAHWKSWR